MSRAMTPQEIVREVREGLRLTLTFGAARADAGDDGGRLSALQVVCLETLPAYEQSGDVQPALDAIHEVMGDGWKPSGEWAEYIDAAAQL